MRSIATSIAISVTCAGVVLTLWEARSIQSIRAATSVSVRELAGLEEANRKKSDEISVIRDTVSNSQTAAAALLGPIEVVPSWKTTPYGSADWNTAESFVDVPKRVLKGIHLAGLAGSADKRTVGEWQIASDAQVTAEAASFLGLTDSQRAEIAILCGKMQDRFLQLEQSHFSRTELHIR